jgi:hypothetical protein
VEDERAAVEHAEAKLAGPPHDEDRPPAPAEGRALLEGAAHRLRRRRPLADPDRIAPVEHAEQLVEIVADVHRGEDRHALFAVARERHQHLGEGLGGLGIAHPGFGEEVVDRTCEQVTVREDLRRRGDRHARASSGERIARRSSGGNRPDIDEGMVARRS